MKLTDEQARLKQYMLDHFDFDGLKQAGFWEKGTRRADFEAQAARVCWYFGYKSVYEYGRELPEVVDVVHVSDLTGQAQHTGVAVVSYPDKVNEAGELVRGDSAWLSVAIRDSFDCPHCTCPQQFKNGEMYYRHKCTGCKRGYHVASDLTGKITVFEK